jgi:hypothetical protein
MGFNYLAELDPTLAKWLSTANTLMGLGFTQDDPVRQFFGASAFDRFEKTPWGTSWVEFKANLAKAKVDRDTRYSTAGACHMVSQQAAIEQANLPGGDPANIDIAKMINERGAVYCDFTYQEVGQVATANAALFVQSVILAKRRINPSKDQVILIVIDEAERYPLDALAQMCEQARSSGITLLLIYHGIEQMEDKWTSIAMTQVMFILGAVPGTKSEKFLQALFGTKIEYVFNFSAGSVTRVESTSETISPTGSSITAGSSISQNEGTCGFTARETFVWTPNDTLDLNNSRDRFVLRISPGAGFSQYGPRPIICQVANRARNFEEINRLADDILKNTPNTILPGESKPKQISAPALTTELSTKRHQFLDTLNRAAARIRESIA